MINFILKLLCIEDDDTLSVAFLKGVLGSLVGFILMVVFFLSYAIMVQDCHVCGV